MDVQCQVGESQGAKHISIKRVQLTDASQLPLDYGTTPGGTLYSTTPGGTRIVYDRAFLMHCRNSPLAKSPPVNLPKIPGVTMIAEEEVEPVSSPKKSPANQGHKKTQQKKGSQSPQHQQQADDQQFQMDL